MKPLEQQQSRINLTDLKTQIVKKLGHDRSKRYFYVLDRLLTKKINKCEFDKSCSWILGRENLLLHNQLIQSILKNACHAKVPPPIYKKEEPSKSTVAVVKKSPLIEDGYQQSGSMLAPVPGQNPPIWSNGDVLHMSPHKCRPVLRDCEFRDRPSPLGPYGKEGYIASSATTPDGGSLKVITENGDLKSYDFQRPVQHHQGFAEKLENDAEHVLQRPTKRPRTKKSPDDPNSVYGHGPDKFHVTDDGEMSQQHCSSGSARSPLSAPLGIPFCLASVGGNQKALLTSNNNSFAISSDSGALFDTETLRRRMEHIVGTQGLEGVSIDCANLLNNGLDVYLKQLIRSCFELVGSRSGHELTKPPSHKHQHHGKVINGIRPEYQLQMQSGVGPMEYIQEFRRRTSISLLDFRAAMELHPRQLGEDWPLLLEKICMIESEE